MEPNGGDSGPAAEEGGRELGAPAKELGHLRNHWEAEERKGFYVPLQVIMLADGDLGNNKITLLCHPLYSVFHL